MVVAEDASLKVAMLVSSAEDCALHMDQDVWWKGACHLAAATEYVRNMEEVQGARLKGASQARRRKVCV